MNEEAVARHIEVIAARFEIQLDAVCDEVDNAIVRAVPQTAADPAIREDMRMSTHSNVRRALLAMRRHAEIVPPRVPTEAMEIVVGMVRRGIGRDAISEAYRLGQQVVWRRWMLITSEVVDRPDDVVDVLAVSLDALFRYVDQVVVSVAMAFDRELDEAAASAPARRAETVRLLLAGAPISEQQVRRRLDYDLAQHNTAFVVWSRTAHRPGALEAASRALARAVHTGPPLLVEVDEHTQWGWLASPRALDQTALADVQLPGDGVRIAVGPSLPGAEGFAASHQRATALHQLVARNRFCESVVLQQDVEVAFLLGGDAPRAAEFVTATLGPLAADDPMAVRLRDTLRIYLEESGNAPRAAERLHTHRNTVLKRVARAEELLGHGLRDRRLAVELALELLRWMPVDDLNGR